MLKDWLSPRVLFSFIGNNANSYPKWEQDGKRTYSISKSFNPNVLCFKVSNIFEIKNEEYIRLPKYDTYDKIKDNFKGTLDKLKEFDITYDLELYCEVFNENLLNTVFELTKKEKNTEWIFIIKSYSDKKEEDIEYFYSCYLKFNKLKAFIINSKNVFLLKEQKKDDFKRLSINQEYTKFLRGTKDFDLLKEIEKFQALLDNNKEEIEKAKRLKDLKIKENLY